MVKRAGVWPVELHCHLSEAVSAFAALRGIEERSLCPSAHVASGVYFIAWLRAIRQMKSGGFYTPALCSSIG